MTKRLPIDAPVLCDDPADRNLGPRHSRLGVARRMLAVLRRRCRRLVRLVLACARHVPRGHPGWRSERRPYRALCAASACRYHLAEFHRDEPLREACALLVANRGGMRQEDVAELLGCERQNVSLIERSALSKQRIRRIADAPEVTAPLEDRLRASLANGERGLAELARRVGADRKPVQAMLEAMVARGELAVSVGGPREGRQWSIARPADLDGDAPDWN